MGYIAPEKFLHYPCDTKVDIFSAGVLLYILLTSEHLFAIDRNICLSVRELNEIVNQIPEKINLLRTN